MAPAMALPVLGRTSAPQHSLTMSLDLNYNTGRDPLVIPEYGRLVQRMVKMCTEEPDRDKRSRMARAVVQAIGKLNPQLRSNENSDRTFWDHLHIMAGFQLDVDCPYPPPTAAGLNTKPRPVGYPKTEIRFGHYGKLVERMIEQCAALEEGSEKVAYTLVIANQMKKQFLAWNRDSVGDAAILKDLAELAKGKLRLAPEQQLQATDVLLQAQRNGPRNAVDNVRRRPGNGNGNNKKRHRNRKKNRF